MKITNIPESVYKKALEIRNIYPDHIPDLWSYKKEYDLLVENSGYSEGELETAICEYLECGEWSSE